MNQQEASRAFEILRDGGIDIIPSLSIRASLEAMIAYKSVNETVNDQVDIMRIVGALPFADIMLIDGAKASDVRELGLDREFRTSVFSGQRADLANLKEKLEFTLASSQKS